ncbi:MAG TPA: GNAT family N-acetyltransferase [Xanthobacteraceae bacterium]
MTPVSIRAATPADIAEITRIYADAVKHGTASFELEPPDEAEMLRRQTALADAGYPYIVAESVVGSAGKLLGYAYAGPYRTRPAYRFSIEDSIYVDPAAQRRGVGRLLLARLIAEAEARGFRQMIAVIGDPAQTASIELHRKAGFRPIGTIENVGFKFGRWLDSVLMQRALGPGATRAP